jgi:DnaJ-class molecular chaperone
MAPDTRENYKWVMCYDCNGRGSWMKYSIATTIPAEIETCRICYGHGQYKEALK